MDTRKLRSIAAAVLFLSVPSAYAGTFDIEYLPTNGDLTDAIGFGIYGRNEEGVHMYTNMLMTIVTRPHTYENLNVNSFGDPVTGYYKEPFVFNVGITRAIGPVLLGYVGVGYASIKTTARKFDPMYILSPNGVYFVPDPSQNSSGINLNVGAVLSLGKLALNIGHNSFIKSTYFGIGASF